MIIDFPNFCVHLIWKKNPEKKKLPLKTYSE